MREPNPSHRVFSTCRNITYTLRAAAATTAAEICKRTELRGYHTHTQIHIHKLIYSEYSFVCVLCIDTVFWPPLTHNVQVDRITAHRLRGYLALIDSRVPLLGPFDLQCPLVNVAMIGGLKALICGVRVCAHGEYVQIPMSYPGHLKEHT